MIFVPVYFWAPKRKPVISESENYVIVGTKQAILSRQYHSFSPTPSSQSQWFILPACGTHHMITEIIVIILLVIIMFLSRKEM